MLPSACDRVGGRSVFPACRHSFPLGGGKSELEFNMVDDRVCNTLHVGSCDQVAVMSPHILRMQVSLE